MKSLIKRLANTDIGIILRNTFNFKPVYLRTYKNNYATSVSDAFLWRTNNGYKTKFKYSDILNLFYKIKNSKVEFHFYSKKNELIKIITVDHLNLSNEIEITSEYLNNIEDYGVFYIHHTAENSNNLDHSNIISNRCYLGYSQNNNLYSFVHGNTLARSRGIYLNENYSTDIVKTSFFNNQSYTIQKYFDDFDKTELFFVNPTSKIIKFMIEGKKYKLNPGWTTLINTKKSIVSIKSNCLFFRPTVFSYRGEFIDVHHS